MHILAQSSIITLRSFRSRLVGRIRSANRAPKYTGVLQQFVLYRSYHMDAGFQMTITIVFLSRYPFHPTRPAVQSIIIGAAFALARFPVPVKDPPEQEICHIILRVCCNQSGGRAHTMSSTMPPLTCTAGIVAARHGGNILTALGQGTRRVYVNKVPQAIPAYALHKG